MLCVVVWCSCCFCALSVTVYDACGVVLFVLYALSGWLWCGFGSDAVSGGGAVMGVVFGGCVVCHA